MRKLTKRLSLIADMIPRGACVCDVGTDHGYLAAALVLTGRASCVTATDINAAPLENARKNLEKSGVSEKVKLVLCDGLSGVKSEEADAVVIAGMGGDVISGIISRCDFIRDSEILLILQPMTAVPQLRRFLGETGFSVVNEAAVCENGKVYSVMAVRFCGVPYAVDEIRGRIGILRPDTPENRKYIEKQYNVCMDCANELKKTENMAEDYERAVFTANEIKKILEE